MMNILSKISDRARDAARFVGVVGWTIWHLPTIVRASMEEERDLRALADDAGMTVDEYRKAVAFTL